MITETCFKNGVILELGIESKEAELIATVTQRRSNGISSIEGDDRSMVIRASSLSSLTDWDTCELLENNGFDSEVFGDVVGEIESLVDCYMSALKCDDPLKVFSKTAIAEAIMACEDLLEYKNCIDDLAPIHVVLSWAKGNFEVNKCELSDRETREYFIDIACWLLSQHNHLEYNPWLPCHICGVEFNPVAEGKLVESYLNAVAPPGNLYDFYRCPDCGGNFLTVESRENKERKYHLPWDDPIIGFDFPG